MRERITYVQKLGDSLEPSAVRVDDDVIQGPEVHAVREDRLTIALDELPSELRTVVAGTQDLHIRWVSTAAYGTVSPLLTRLPPGFHLFFTPGRNHAVTDGLCSILSGIFGDISCTTPAESFTAVHEDRFQYFQELNDLSHFIQYAKGQLCGPSDESCSARLDTLSEAGSLDLSYDISQKVLRVTALWPYQRQHVHATSRPKVRTEVGILSTDKPKTLEAHEIGISGLLTVLGQDSTPSPTMFSFASRHRDAESAFSAEFLTPTGLHPTLQLQLTSANPPPSTADEDATCTPYAYLTLPRTIFADKYQLSDPLFLASKNLTALRHTTQPVDLEAPEYAMAQWGSTVLLELSPPPPTQPHQQQEGEWTASIPLHLRYLAPAPGGYATAAVPYPAVFWACEPAQGGTVFPPNPFERTHLGYDGLFRGDTVFWHVEPRPAAGGGLLVNEVRVPVLDVDRAGWVNAGTAAAVLVGFAWVVWKIVGVWAGGVNGGGAEEREKKRQ
ncbi:PIG-X [Chaetomium fimeti]|uniref:Protein PBN1 n=1 Tax=Chaetomium fimeti TaxID=1854472 RepID=A0AAE0LSC9_9PEZI|nr:PIG-X [Chaetomium fimeti]